MQTESSNADAQKNHTGSVECPSCHTAMPRQLRFCRSCGFRLGEGSAEYTETVRLPNQTAGARTVAGTGKYATQVGTAGNMQDWNAMAQQSRQQAMSQAGATLERLKQRRAGRRRPHWIVWAVLGITIATVSAGGFLSRNNVFINRPGSSSSRRAAQQNSYFGSHFETVNGGGGAFIKDISPPGSAADKAGLVGGDTVTSFDGKVIKGRDDLSSALSHTPPGKTVDVVYLRDGVSKTVQLTTLSEDENQSLADAFDDQPHGFLGVDNFERVAVPNTNTYGVRLGKIVSNSAAETAGLRVDDIVTEFNGVPIRTREEFESRIHRAAPKSPIKLVVIRDGKSVEINGTMGGGDDDDN